ncbi:hypothetical protein D3C78_1573990 [compost metagenome]
MQFYTLAANQGHAKAQYLLALGYYFGVGVVEDLIEAQDLLNKSVVGGNVEALVMLKNLGLT